MKIKDIRATTVSVPLEAPLRHSNGAHWGRFVRTIVEVETDDGYVGLGEMGGGGESAELSIRALIPYVIGHDPRDLEALPLKLANPTASLYNHRTQMVAAIEFACLDILGKYWSCPVYQILGGKLRDRIPFASYLFYRYPNAVGEGEVRTVEQLVEHARALKTLYGFQVHKLKGGVFPPWYELEAYRALVESFPQDRFRWDPNAAWSVTDTLAMAHAIAGLPNDYLEDPTWGLNGMRQIRDKTSLLLATNTVVVNREQLVANLRDPAVDVILLDTTFWGGMRACLKAATICDAFQVPIGVHSSGELGIQLATMLHLAAVLPNLTFAADAHYHHLQDDVVVGGKLPYRAGAMTVPEGPGLGVVLDRDRLGYYAQCYQELGGYPYDRDPGRPSWYPLLPNSSWADPADDGSPMIPSRPAWTADRTERGT